MRKDKSLRSSCDEQKQRLSVKREADKKHYKSKF